jgi:hypothetical protein
MARATSFVPRVFFGRDRRTVKLVEVEELNERGWRELAGVHLCKWSWDPDRCCYGFWLQGARRLRGAAVPGEIVFVGG